jgi:nicotinamidase-related amidase
MSATAILMVDFQRDFCAPGGYADRCGGIGWVGTIVPAARRLLDAARNAGHFVVHTREGYAADLSDCFTQRVQRSRKAGGEIGSHGPLGRLLIRGEYGHDIIDELRPDPGELVLDKTTYGAFCRSNLEEELRARDVAEIAICGVTADVCVHTTLREATDRGFSCRYVRDAISTFDPIVREVCERMVEQEGGVWGTLNTSLELAARWRSMPNGSGPELGIQAG